jgi:hypothetical protein
VTPDLVNGLFELIGALSIYGHVRRLRRDREVRGVYWPSVAFFTAWGAWNLFYYPSLGQWFSFTGGFAIATMNTWWVYLLLKYRSR